MSRENTVEKRIALLRAVMKKKKINSFLVPHEDERLSENTPKNYERLSWISGFTGSAGYILITLNNLYLFVDGRYTLQAKQQTKSLKTKVLDIGNENFYKLLRSNKNKLKNIALDNKVFSVSQYNDLIKEIKSIGLKVINLKKNIIDLIWKRNLKIQKTDKIFILEKKYAGLSYEKKLNYIFSYLKKYDADAIFIQDSESIAWLLNLRGRDLDFTPIVFSFSFITRKKVYVFLEDKKLPKKIIKSFSKSISFLNYNEIQIVLNKITHKKICTLLDPNSTSKYYYNLLKKNSKNVFFIKDPIQYYKSIKNLVEIKNIKKAHLIDGIAICKFLYWINNLKSDITELQVVEKLDSFRSINKDYLSNSFPTIAGSGPNGAIIHYIPNLKSNRKINKNDILLLDSGGQYKLGTTDVTRTIALGKTTKQQIINYTLVLKGHINLGLAIFPEGTSGSYLDVIARSSLWKKGKDFAHGTGHGVGYCLNVHEGPFSISNKNSVSLKQGMVFSNEPGYYLENQYGIRIENLVTTKNINYNNKKFLMIDTLTLAPYENKLIDKNMLSNDEKSWLIRYNKKLYNKISPFLSNKERRWLQKICSIK